MDWFKLISLAQLFSSTIVFGKQMGSRCMYVDYIGRVPSFGEDCMNTSVCKKKFNITLMKIEPYFTYNLFQSIFHECCGKCTKFSYVNNISYIQNISSSKIKSSHFIYPILARTTTRRIYGYHFIPVLEAPTVIYVTMKDKLILEKMLYSCLEIYPLIVTCLLMGFISGFLAWIMETWTNKDQFSRPFLIGWFEGVWWSFITMTTVGYGDKTPKSVLARIYSIIWILIGIIAFDILTASLTAEILKANSPPLPSISGSKVAALKHYTYDTMVIAQHGGSLIPTKSEDFLQGVAEMIRMLKEKKIDGFLLDKYAFWILMKKGKYKDFFKNTDQTEKQYNRERLSHGLLVQNDDDYEYFKDAITDNNMIQETGLSLNWNQAKEKPYLQKKNIFGPSGPYFVESLLVISTILGIIVIFGMIFELLRIKVFRRKNGPISN